MVTLLDPAEIPRPGVQRDPGVRASPGVIQDPRAAALNSFSRDMSVVAGVFEELHKKRVESEDSMFVDSYQLEYTKRAAQIESEALNSPDISNPKFVDILDKRLEEAQNQALNDVLTNGGFTPSENGRTKANEIAMNLRISTARSATGKAHNQRVTSLLSSADDNVQEIARIAAATGDLEGGLARVDSVYNSIGGFVAPEKGKVWRQAARKTLLESVVEGHIARKEYDKAQEIVDRETGFAVPDAGEVENTIISAAKEQGADPAVALAIAVIESGGDPTAKNPRSSASGLFQITKATGEGLGLPEDASTASVEDQAKAGARLIAINSSALRRSLGGEPTPSEIYLAHFLGAGDAVRVLKSEPGTPLADVLTPEVLEANPHLDGMTADDILDWAAGKMGDAMGVAAGSIDGREITPEAATIPIDDAITLSKRVTSARREQKVSLDGLIKDDVASIKSTGKPIGIDETAAQSVLTPREMEDWQADREDAATFYEATNDMARLPETEIRGRLEALEPRPGEVGFARAEKVHADVQKEAERLVKLRNEDPAHSVSDVPVVVAAAEAFDANNPGQSWQTLMKARLSAQKSVGIPEGLQGVLTQEELRRFAGAISRAPEDEFYARFEELGATFEETFGEYADDALKQVVGEFVKGEQKTAAATRIIRNLISRQAVPLSDAQAFDEAAESDNIDAVSRSLSDEQEMLRELRGDPAFIAGQQQAIEDARSGRMPALIPIHADDNAIQYLREHPETLADFIAVYGEEQVPEDLRQVRGRR